MATPVPKASKLWRIPVAMPTFGYLSDLGECLGDLHHSRIHSGYKSVCRE
jgi:hypothetical protein